jgi:hypothetical protein
MNDRIEKCKNNISQRKLAEAKTTKTLQDCDESVITMLLLETKIDSYRAVIGARKKLLPKFKIQKTSDIKTFF